MNTVRLIAFMHAQGQLNYAVINRYIEQDFDTDSIAKRLSEYSRLRRDRIHCLVYAILVAVIAIQSYNARTVWLFSLGSVVFAFVLFCMWSLKETIATLEKELKLFCESYEKLDSMDFFCKIGPRATFETAKKEANKQLIEYGKHAADDGRLETIYDTLCKFDMTDGSPQAYRDEAILRTSGMKK